MPRIPITPGYTISRILKGGWQLAGGHGTIDRGAALDDMARFVDAGITTFDCADIYTGVEELIGEFLRGRRSGTPVQVHTKFVPDLDTLATLTGQDVDAAIDRSLARLGTERLDLVQFHWWNYAVPRYVEVAGWLDDCRRAGKIANLGVTNFDTARLRELIDAGVPIVSHQVQYSVLDRRPALRQVDEPAPSDAAPMLSMAEFCEQAGIQLLCYGGVAGGFLSARYLDQPEPVEPLENRSLVKYRLIIREYGEWDRFQRLLRTLHEIAMRHEVSIGTVALRWVLDQPRVAGVIVGARHAGHLDDLCRVPTLELTSADREAIAGAQAGAAGPSGGVYGLEREPGGVHGSIMRYTLNAKPPVR